MVDQSFIDVNIAIYDVSGNIVFPYREDSREIAVGWEYICAVIYLIRIEFHLRVFIRRFIKI